jgi:hypothetical protein
VDVNGKEKEVKEKRRMVRGGLERRLWRVREVDGKAEEAKGQR